MYKLKVPSEMLPIAADIHVAVGLVVAGIVAYHGLPDIDNVAYFSKKF
jgi:hypothetical protein